MKEFCFPSCWKISSVVPLQHLRTLGKGLQLQTTALLVFFRWLVKSLKNLLIIGLLITYKNVAFLISSVVVGILDQPRIF